MSQSKLPPDLEDLLDTRDWPGPSRHKLWTYAQRIRKALAGVTFPGQGAQDGDDD